MPVLFLENTNGLSGVLTATQQAIILRNSVETCDKADLVCLPTWTADGRKEYQQDDEAIATASNAEQLVAIKLRWRNNGAGWQHDA